MAVGNYQSTTGLCTWSGWSGVTTADKTLSLTAEFDADASGGSSIMTISYTLDGSTVTTLVSRTASLAAQGYSVTVPSGTNLANVSVTARSFSTVTRTSGNYSTAQITVSNLKIQ